MNRADEEGQTSADRCPSLLTPHPEATHTHPRGIKFPISKILIIRNDRIGDFVLAWPAFAILKSSMECHLVALISPAVESLAKICPWIDGYIIDDKKNDSALIQTIKSHNFDVGICLYKKSRNAIIIFAAKIPRRISWTRRFKLYNILLSERIYQSREIRDRSEYEYNCDVVRTILQNNNFDIKETRTPFLFLNPQKLTAIETLLSNIIPNPTTKNIIMLHPGTGGSAKGVGSKQIIQLITELTVKNPTLHFLLCGGPSEIGLINYIHHELQNINVVSYTYSPNDLEEYAYAMSFARIFIAGSTGPLHLASALDIPTIGFYPGLRAANHIRWQTLNSPSRRLAFSGSGKLKDPFDLSDINMLDVVEAVTKWDIFAAISPR